jgi:anti-anti-sigma factor
MRESAPPQVTVAPTAQVTVAPTAQVTVAPTGDFDAASYRSVEREVRQLYGSGVERVVLDLRNVGFLDSSGLRALISLRNDAKRTRRGLTLVPGPPGVQRIFVLTATRGLFDWHEGNGSAARPSRPTAGSSGGAG